MNIIYCFSFVCVFFVLCFCASVDAFEVWQKGGAVAGVLL